MPGIIKRVESVPYEYAIPETGELIKLAHTYEYAPERDLGMEAPVRRLEVA